MSPLRRGCLEFAQKFDLWPTNGTAGTVGMNERLVARLKRQQSQKDCAQVTADTQTCLLRAVSAREPRSLK